MSLFVRALETRAATRLSRLKPTLSVPRISGCCESIDQIGTVTTCRMPPACGQNELLRARRAIDARQRRARSAVGMRAEAISRSAPALAPVGDDAAGRRELLLILLGDRLHRRRIVGVDRRLQARQVGDEPRLAREVLDQLDRRYSSMSVPASSRPRRSSCSACAVTATLTL